MANNSGAVVKTTHLSLINNHLDGIKLDVEQTPKICLPLYKCLTATSRVKTICYNSFSGLAQKSQLRSGQQYLIR